MDNIYLIIVICLGILAISDLVVGVSNDAVNFLNSAFGSKVAQKKTILIIATIGIAAGALTSSGMMEIARKGIFNPEMFTFADVMIIFLAVMIADILLLDFFNTYGLPTSTTISIMFELLGAAFVLALIKIYSSNQSITDLGLYINSKSAWLIIGGIFLSVFIAFGIGAFVQYVTRMFFTFNIEKTLTKFGSVFGGIAISTITYFMLIKGMKGSSLISQDINNWMESNTLLLISGIFIFWTLVCFGLIKLFKVNILKVIVLMGTFSLAMAFAGNDLVNFIGVPLAGLQSFEIYSASGVQADELGMGMLNDKIHTHTLVLLFAALVMILTIWFSKKAQSVTETEINLARESAGSERFKPNFIARLIVKGGLNIGKITETLIPNKIEQKIERRFLKEKNKNTKDQPAFDLVRASVNLMTASILISFATSLKLPLSTTYVSFMVAMGTSLADKAWNRDTAIFRVAGVIHVISGWLFTAAIAFSAAGIIATTIYFGGKIAIIGLMVLTAFLIVRSHFLHKKLESKKKTFLENILNKDIIRKNEIYTESKNKVSSTLFIVSYVFKDSLLGLKNSDKKMVNKAKVEVEKYNLEYNELKANFYYYLKKIEIKGKSDAKFYLHVLNSLQNINQSINLITSKIHEHISNYHKPLEDEKMDELNILGNKLSNLFLKISEYIDNPKKWNIKLIEDESNDILKLMDEYEENQIYRIKDEKTSPKNSMLYISVLLECRDILSDFTDMVMMFNDKENLIPVEPVLPKINA